MKIAYLSLAIVLALIKEANSFGELNKTEVALCYDVTNPTSLNDCKVIDNFKSIVCCFFKMTHPGEGNMCIPIERTSLGLSGDAETNIFNNIIIKGKYDCNTTSYLILNFTIILFIIAILIY